MALAGGPASANVVWRLRLPAGDVLRYDEYDHHCQHVELAESRLASEGILLWPVQHGLYVHCHQEPQAHNNKRGPLRAFRRG